MPLPPLHAQKRRKLGTPVLGAQTGLAACFYLLTSCMNAFCMDLFCTDRLCMNKDLIFSAPPRLCGGFGFRDQAEQFCGGLKIDGQASRGLAIDAAVNESTHHFTDGVLNAFEAGKEIRSRAKPGPLQLRDPGDQRLP